MKEKKSFWAGIEKSERRKFVLFVILMFLTQAVLMCYLIINTGGAQARCAISASSIPGIAGLK